MPKKNEPKALNKIPTHHGIGPDPEKCDPTPVEIPIGKGMPPTMAEQIAEAVHAQLSARDNQEFETPEEADDFDEDDPDFLDMSPYERYFHETEIEEMTPSIQEPDPPPEPEEAGVEPAESEA